jgi:hypothetical protein
MPKHNKQSANQKRAKPKTRKVPSQSEHQRSTKRYTSLNILSPTFFTKPTS